MEPATPNMTPRAAAARWKEAVLSPWSPEEMASVSPSLDGYVPFGAEPPPRRPLRPVNGFSGSGLSANGLTKRTPQGQPAKDRTPPVLAVQPGFSPEQNRKLGALRQAAAEPYDASAHEQMLRELWAWGKLGSEGSFSRVSPCWRTLGFRQDDPALDLHGCGAIGLRQLVHFCARGGAHAALAADAFPVSPFPLAMASLNVTLALCSHLRLLPAAASSQPPCADPTLRNFLRFTADLEPACALDLMHAECLRGLAEVWASMQAPGLTPMQFTEALRLLNEHVAEALAGAAPPWQASEVLMRLRAFGGGVEGFDIDAYGSDLCLGSALGGVGDWMPSGMGDWIFGSWS